MPCRWYVHVDNPAGKGEIWERTASVDVDLSVIDMRNTMADQIAQAAKVHLQTISGATHFQKEIGIKTYILSKLFTPKYPPR